MSRVPKAFRDSSLRAADVLNETLNPGTSPIFPDSPEISNVPDSTIDVDGARAESPILSHNNERQALRLCVFTKDTSILEEGSASYERIADGQNLFLETHVILIDARAQRKETPPIRLFKNVWIYTVSNESWWHSTYHAYMIACEQLSFSGGFRADVIVAEDSFESGLAGWFVSKKFKRPFQLHVLDDFFDEEFLDSIQSPLAYTWSTSYLLRHAQSIRTKTETQRQIILEEYASTKSTVEVLPVYYNLRAWRDFVPTVSLREMYPRFKFIILHVSLMNAQSHTDHVLNGATKLIRTYPTVGLIIVGNGPLRSSLERRAISLGIQKQVEFLPMPQELISYMKSANVLVHLSENSEEEDVLLEAAVSRLPIIATTHGLAGSLFTDGDSAFLCSHDDTACISARLNQYLNDNNNRSRFALNANALVFDRIVQDYDAYLLSYKESIERSIVEVHRTD